MILPRASKLHHYRGEVIFGAALMNNSFQLVGRALRVFVLGEHSRDFAIGHMSIDTVAAKQEARTVGGFDRFCFDLNRVFDSERAIDYVEAFKRRRLRFGYSACPDVVVEIGVIDSLARELPILETVDPAVAYVSDGDLAAFDVNERNRRSHRLIGRIGFGQFEYIAIRKVESAAYRIDGIAVRRGVGESFFDGFRGSLTGDFAGALAAYAVEYRKQATFGYREKTILIHRAFGVEPSIADIARVEFHKPL